MNNALTKKVTELHNLGYDGDFSIDHDYQFLSMQSNLVFLKESIAVKLIDQVYDKIFDQYKYLYVVESDNGEKGILLLDYVHFDGTGGCNSEPLIN